MNHVAGFALLLRQVEFFVETWACELEEDAGEGGEVQPPKPLVAAAQWYSMGQQILKAIVNDANGEGEVGGEEGAPAEGAEGEEVAAEQMPEEEVPAEAAPAEEARRGSSG